jgi:hypothetical protein
MLAHAAGSCCRPVHPLSRETVSLRETSLSSAESLKLSFTDEAGRSFDLSLERRTSAYSLTYDRRGGLQPEAGQGRGLALGHRKEARSEALELRRAFREMDLAVAGFQKLLHRFLQAVDPGYARHYRSFDPVAARLGVVEHEYAEFLSVHQSVTVTLSMPADAPADYWSVEATAGRLRDFAVSLFGGGDRAFHAAEMARGMETGLRQAQQAFGGALPEISRQTVDLAKEWVAQWAAEAVAEAPELDLVA